MNLEHLEDAQMRIHIPMQEARDILKALMDMHEKLGESAHALEQTLREGGVTLPEADDHRRYEYMPPADRP